MLIGIDGGGTKTALCLAGLDGRVIRKWTGEGTNPVDIGLEECEKRLRVQLRALLDGVAGETGAGVRSVYAGIAGGGSHPTNTRMRAILRAILPDCPIVENGSDAFNALYGEIGDGEGIALIAGTGSSAFIISGKDILQVGGWGYLVDDAGSGFRIGADALRAAYRAMDGRGSETALRAAIEEKFGVPLAQAIPIIYQGGKALIASLSPLVFRTAQEGDKAAMRIVDDAARALVAHIRACGKHIKRFPAMCVVSGGLTKDARFMMAIRLALREDTEHKYILRVPDVPPVYGALLRAAYNNKRTDMIEFRRNFIETYA